MSYIWTIIPAQAGVSGSVAITAGTPKYCKLNDNTIAPVAASDFTVEQTVLVPTVISNLWGRLDAAPGSGKNVVVTLYVNGVASTLTFTISGTSAKEGSDILDVVKLNAGDYYALLINPDAGSSSTKFQGGALVAV